MGPLLDEGVEVSEELGGPECLLDEGNAIIGRLPWPYLGQMEELLPPSDKNTFERMNDQSINHLDARRLS